MKKRAALAEPRASLDFGKPEGNYIFTTSSSVFLPPL